MGIIGTEKEARVTGSRYTQLGSTQYESATESLMLVERETKVTPRGAAKYSQSRLAEKRKVRAVGRS